MSIDNVTNILDVYNSATEDELRQGADWYQAAHTFAVGLSERYDVGLETACAVVAVLSPRLSWKLNLEYADRYLRTGDCPTFFSTKRKLARLMNGEEPLDVLGGRKVRSFYDNILYLDASVCVTIDRHAFDVFNGKVADDVDRKALEKKGAYDECEDAYITAAEILGVPAHVVQAVTWLAWKRTKPYADQRHATQFRVSGTMTVTVS